ncbi:unnamed protein product [Clonostachys byssicola]|uniref:Uncharacterized protein n=1 Tax=Clonostachys byssicola TaxID=160290 RepID=A0A9N9UXX0_9HYPO|nr:unnamed protein product [Clonostachys byssicola]
MHLIRPEVDFINVMYHVVIHHTGVTGSNAAVQRYMDRGAPPAQYVKWYRTAAACEAPYPLGCLVPLMEDRETGADLGMTGGFSWVQRGACRARRIFSPGFDTWGSSMRIGTTGTGTRTNYCGGIWSHAGNWWRLWAKLGLECYKNLRATTEGLEALARGKNGKDEL